MSNRLTLSQIVAHIPICLGSADVCVIIHAKQKLKWRLCLFALIPGLLPPWLNEDNRLSNEAFMGYRTHLIDTETSGLFEMAPAKCGGKHMPSTHTHIHRILYKHKVPRQLSDSKYYPRWSSRCPHAAAPAGE